MNKITENNVMDFPTEHRDNLRILEALLFAASEPLDAESIKARLPKKANLEKLINFSKFIKKDKLPLIFEIIGEGSNKKNLQKI